jgi:hypothetical protein
MRVLTFVLMSIALQVPTTQDLAAVRTVNARTPQAVQMAIARAAGPPVSASATILVLGPRGYEKAQSGSNGFTCLIERSPINTMAPQCFDAVGSDSTVRVFMFIEEQRARGVSEAEIAAAVEDGYHAGRFTAPSRPGIVYMLSDYNYLADPDTHEIVHFPGHLMFYAPYLTPKEIGAGPGAPQQTHPGKPDNLLVVVPATVHPH